MTRSFLGCCLVIAVTFGPALSASPLAAADGSPQVVTTSCPLPAVALFTPAQSSPAPDWLSSGDCWYTYQQCLQPCDINAGQQDPCWLACNCAYCVCEGIACIEECNGPVS
jgi:hypothetical protein